MRKLFLALALGISLCASAQLTVFENGQVRVGNNQASCTTLISTLDVSDSQSSLSASTHMPSGTLTFGSGVNAMISGCSGAGYLRINSGRNLEIGVGNNPSVLSMMHSSDILTSQFHIKAPSFLTSSDARLKTNVESLTNSFNGLWDVNAVSYNLLQPSGVASGVMALKDGAVENEGVKDDRTHFGFIAQEIQKIYPNLVVEDEEGLLAIDYTGFIPLLVEAYKDLSSKVKEQEEVIDALLSQKGPSYMPASINGLTDSKATLKQNKPNPFNTTTTIECTVPHSVTSAFICVYDLQGKQVHRIDIRERGDIVNVIDAAYFAPGMYIYALIADGVEIDSKRMIITD